MGRPLLSGGERHAVSDTRERFHWHFVGFVSRAHGTGGSPADGTGGADPGWDICDITGVLNITAGSGTDFTIDLTTLTLGNLAGAMDAFNPASNHAWTIATADGGITGFDASDFILSLTGFGSAYAGTFGIVQNGNNISLIYTGAIVSNGSVPEPASASVLMVSVGDLWLCQRRTA